MYYVCVLSRRRTYKNTNVTISMTTGLIGRAQYPNLWLRLFIYYRQRVVRMRDMPFFAPFREILCLHKGHNKLLFMHMVSQILRSARNLTT
jgi:hypothetical protein